MAFIVVRTENYRENLQWCAHKMMEEIRKVAHGKLTKVFPKVNTKKRCRSFPMVHAENDGGDLQCCTQKFLEASTLKMAVGI